MHGYFVRTPRHNRGEADESLVGTDLHVICLSGVPVGCVTRKELVPVTMSYIADQFKVPAESLTSTATPVIQ